MSNEKNIPVASALDTLEGIKTVYFIGIGGIGMSAIARYFHSKGVAVGGYDKTETALTKDLKKEGITIHYTDDVAQIPKKVDLVVYTPAIPKDHAGLNYYRSHDFKVVKRSDVLGAITADQYNICVAGTHGKTTISTMIAHILRHTEFGCNAFLGGIATNYNTNFWSDENDVCVVEADEYDRSFLKLNPDIAIISAMDADHLDIYGDENSMQDAFIQFGSRLKKNGLLISRHGLKRVKEIKADKKWTYSLANGAADVFSPDVRISEGGYTFSVQLPDASIEDVRLNIGGMHNVENALAAIAVAHSLDIDSDKIRAAVAGFRGVRRRFEYIIPPVPHKNGAYTYPVMIDDYAHHPEELKALLKSAHALFPGRKVTVIFQPHLFSRTKDFADGFAESLSLADEVVLLPIYPARELPMEDVNSEMILSRIDRKEKQVVPREQLEAWMKNYVKSLNREFGEVIITAGAGDIDALVQPLKKIIEQA